MSGATTDGDMLRLRLDDVLALLREADEQLLPAVTRMAQNARSDDDGRDLLSVRLARRAIAKARGKVSDLHCNGYHDTKGKA